MESSSTISLVDNTTPTDTPRQPAERTHSRRFSARDLSRRLYGRHRPHKSGISADTRSVTSDSESAKRGPSLTDLSPFSTHTTDGGSSSKLPQVTQRETTSALNQTPSTEHRASDTNPAPQQQEKKPKPVSEVDSLYENQRGWFAFGIPHYSHQTLLQFDPGAWVTPQGKDSAVNITNAQVPDPSWEWAWKTWYVDMSGDVDEQGWQYSLRFSSSAWHGTHPWFHCFVRRRRWLRLRVKHTTTRDLRGRSKLERAHVFNEDYFTIHSSAARDLRQMSIAPGSVAPSGYSSAASGDNTDLELDEIGDIPTLMYALKGAIVDREKLDYLKLFVEQGGEELYYLEERVG